MMIAKKLSTEEFHDQALSFFRHLLMVSDPSDRIDVMLLIVSYSTKMSENRDAVSKIAEFKMVLFLELLTGRLTRVS